MQHFELESGRAFFRLAHAFREYLNAPETWVSPDNGQHHQTVRVCQKDEDGNNKVAESPFDLRDFDKDGALHAFIGLALSHYPNSFPKHYFTHSIKVRVSRDQIKVDLMKAGSPEEASDSFVISPEASDWTGPAKKMAEELMAWLSTSAFDPWTVRNSGKRNFSTV
jgi:hypothetical protein